MFKKIEGINTALITPFDQKGNIDEEGLRILINRQIESGVNGIVVVAGSGEFVNLTEEERAFVVKTSVEEVNNRIPLFAGVFTPGTREAVAWSKKAADLGVDALLVLTPYYNRPSMEGVFMHYKEIADATNVPIIVYNNPGRTSLKLLPDDYVQLSKIPEIIGIKECNRDLGDFSRTISLLNDKWSSILCGDDDMLYSFFGLGAKGGILTTSNILPSLWVKMYQSILDGNYEKAREYHYEVLPYFQLIMTANHPALIKKTLSLMGLPGGKTRLPLADTTEDQENRIRSMINKLNLKIK